MPGLRTLAFTTNGYRLAHRAQSYYDAGLRAVNISIDSLNPRRFHCITGQDRLGEVLAGLAACHEAGFQTVKINTVLLKGLNEAELDDFVALVRDQRVSVRFIELMRTHDNKAYFSAHHVSGAHVKAWLLARGWRLKPRQAGDGPAQEFEHADCQGSIGLITPYANDFCTTCNRLRVSARGELHLCLFGEGGYSLRHLLQADDQQSGLEEAILSILNFKKPAHLLRENNSGIRDHLASIGG